MLPESVGTLRPMYRERQTLRGAVLLGAVSLLLLAVLVAVAWLDGYVRGLSWLIWVPIALLALLLLSLETLLVQDYWRLHVRPNKEPKA